jgi:hypothetical protein
MLRAAIPGIEGQCRAKAPLCRARAAALAREEVAEADVGRSAAGPTRHPFPKCRLRLLEPAQAPTGPCEIAEGGGRRRVEAQRPAQDAAPLRVASAVDQHASELGPARSVARVGRQRAAQLPFRLQVPSPHPQRAAETPAQLRSVGVAHQRSAKDRDAFQASAQPIQDLLQGEGRLRSRLGQERVAQGTFRKPQSPEREPGAPQGEEALGIGGRPPRALQPAQRLSRPTGIELRAGERTARAAVAGVQREDLPDLIGPTTALP